MAKAKRDRINRNKNRAVIYIRYSSNNQSDGYSIEYQLEQAKCMDRIDKPYHQKILKEELPYSRGGGIGQSRIFMLMLGKEHIAEVQASTWEEKTYEDLKGLKIL